MRVIVDCNEKFPFYKLSTPKHNFEEGVIEIPSKEANWIQKVHEELEVVQAYLENKYNEVSV